MKKTKKKTTKQTKMYNNTIIDDIAKWTFESHEKPKEEEEQQQQQKGRRWTEKEEEEEEEMKERERRRREREDPPSIPAGMEGRRMARRSLNGWFMGPDGC